MMKETDGQLYIRFLNDNDDDAFRVLYETYNEGLTLFLNGIVGNIHDAEELMMDTYAVLYSGTVRYKERNDASFKTWLFGVAKNQARMFLRKHKVVLSELDENTAGEDRERPEELFIANERNAKLYQAMNMLATDYRQVLFLIYFEDMKTEQISRVMKKSVKQVYNLTARGKTALKEALESMGYTWEM